MNIPITTRSISFFILCILVAICSCQTNSFRLVFSSEQNEQPTKLNEVKIYKLTKQAEYADFDILNLKNIDSWLKDSIALRKAFEPIKGKYNYYQFISTFEGIGMIFPGDNLKDSTQVFHDILIVKTDNRNRIIDAFQYTLEWSEYPGHYELFRSTNNDLLLTNNMDISKLVFTRSEYLDKKDKLLSEKGIIRLQ